MRTICRGLLVTCALFGALATTAEATTLIADPGGHGTECTALNPCSIEGAADQAATGDLVRLNSGEYKPETGEYEIELAGEELAGPESGWVTVFGTVTAIGGTVRNVSIDAPDGTALTLNTGATADRVIAESDSTGCVLTDGAALSNSACQARALEPALEASGSVSLENATILGHGDGVHVAAGGTLTAVNSVMRGGGDVLNSDIVSPAGSTLQLTNDNYATISGTGTVTATGSQSADPDLGFLYAPSPTSPVRNAGVDSAVSAGELDLLGDLRQLDGTVDIGAVEVVPAAPAITSAAATDIRSTTATVPFTIETNGSRMSVAVRYGTAPDTYANYPFVEIPASAQPVNGTIRLTGLAPQTTYYYRVSAETPLEVMGASDERSFTTTAQPAPRTVFAAPGGSGVDCTTAAPCTLADAAGIAYDGDTISVAPGTHGSPEEPVTVAPAHNVDLLGAVTGPGRPVILGTVAMGGGGRVADLEIRQGFVDTDHDAALVLGDDDVGDRLLVRQPSGSARDTCELEGTARLRNSLCLSMPTVNSAASLFNDGSGTATGITALGADYGLFSFSGFTGRNAILRGTIKDVDSGTGALININAVTIDAASSTITNPQTAAPVYAGPGDYRQGVGSPTIDAGDDPSVLPGELDLNGNLRKLGAHTDIGAYEFVPGAPLIALGAPATTGSGATLGFTLDTLGGRTDVRVLYGTAADDLSSATPVVAHPAAAAPVATSVALSGLQAATQYHFKVEANSDGGAAAVTGTFTTKANSSGGGGSGPTPTPTPSPSPSASPVPSASPSPPPSPEPRLPLTAKLRKGAFGKRSASVLVTCLGPACAGTVRGTLTVGGEALGQITRKFAMLPGVETRVKLRLGRALRSKLKRALKDDPDAKVRLRIVARFATADGQTATQRTRLKR